MAARKSHAFAALRVTGGILPPEFLRTVAALKAPRQNGADYGLSQSLALKDEIARYWRIAGDLYSRYALRRARRDLDARRVGVKEWLEPLLRSVLGYDDLTAAGSAAERDRVFKLTHRACGGAVPLLLEARGFDLDKADPHFGWEGRREAPHGLVQEYLNAADACLWGIVSNGAKLRILRDNPSLTRPACIEADLDLIFEEELYPDFAALWLVAHAGRLQPADGKPSGCILETWRAEAHKTGERALQNLRSGVADALRSLGNGFLQHADNSGLRTALRSGALTPEDWFRQLLGLVYRLLFLFTAEERGLLHAPDAAEAQRAVYAQGYSLARLRERALRRRHYDRHRDLWQSLRIAFAALDRGAPALGLPALGGLFRREQCPDLDGAAIANAHLLEAVRALAFFPSGAALVRVNYRDMGTEELGSVYESLLELQPALDVDASPWTFDLVGGKGSARKLTGSYYTPPALVHELIRSALDPAIARAVAEHPEDPRAAVLELKVVDPACGSGHFLLAAARRMAAEIVRLEAGDDDETARRQALREVAQRCIYGVDRNPLAIALCKAALWIETVEPGKPLSFLDAHVLCGDSLIGVLDPAVMAEGIPDAAYKPLTGDDKIVCRDLKRRNRQTGRSVQGSLLAAGSLAQAAAPAADWEDMPEETIDDVDRKRAAWETGDKSRAREKLRADLFVGAFFARKTRDALETAPLGEDLNRLDKGLAMRPGVEAAARESAARHGFFHWRSAFAEVMRRGGFDVVIGNPPWERVKLQEQEFFASRSPEIAAAPNKAARNRLIERLALEAALPAEKTLFAEFETARREAEASSLFIRGGGRFPLTGVGDVNTYAVFAETFLRLLSPKGRAGLIAPTGIATDHSTKAFFDETVAGQRLVSLYDFENREGVFSGVHRSYKFCLLTLTGAGLPCSAAPEFAFFCTAVEQLRDAGRRFALSAEDIRLFNPNTRTCPIFRVRRDMEIARKMYRRAGVFRREAQDEEPEANPWGAKFQRMFDMANDSGLFRTREQLAEAGWRLQGNVFARGKERYLPLYEAKLFHQYDHRFATFEGVSTKDIRNGNARQMTAQEKANPETVIVPRYWVPENEVAERVDKREAVVLDTRSGAEPSRTGSRHPRRTRPQLALRKITNATNERTGVFAMIPPFGLSDSGTTIVVGSLSSGISQAPQTNEHPSSPPYRGERQ